MRSLRLQSPAKLNLFLKIIDKRPDGYHNLETIFERINLFDDIEFILNGEKTISIFSDHPDLPTDSRNLVYKAAALVRDHFGLENGIDIKITKRIPVAAGLAGGSSNAATTLMGLNQIWKLNLTTNDLVFFGRQLGSDVPFFLHDCSWALGTSRGDQIEPLEIKTQLWHILVVPAQKMLTKEVFERVNLELTKEMDDVNILIRSLKDYDLPAIRRSMKNDLEKTIVKMCPLLEDLKRFLGGLSTQGVGFSGSGPSIFAITQTQSEAEHLRSILLQKYTQVYVVRTH